MWGLGLLVALAVVSPPQEEILRRIAEAVHENHVRRPPQRDVLALSLDQVDAYLKRLDPHSAYLSADEYLRQKDAERNGYPGIGVELAMDARGIVLIPFSNGPAHRAGVTTRTHLLGVNGTAIAGLDLQQVGHLLTGAEGSPVRLSLAQPDALPPHEVVVTREHFRPPSVEVARSHGSPYLNIRRFIAHETTAALRVALRRGLNGAGPLVLDLRDCTGGDLHESMDAASLFLPSGKLLASIVDGSGTEQRFYSLPEERVFDRPVLVLVGPSTASAAEVFAFALRYYREAKLIGQPTYGKCSSQTYVELPDGSALRLTNRRIVYPNGESCAGKGLAPDLMVPESEIYDTDRLIERGMSLVGNRRQGLAPQ